MQKLFIEITMSVDGFIAGTNISKKDPMGEGGQRLHEWLFKNKTSADEALAKQMTDNTGAVIVGSRTYSTAIEDAWEGESPFAVPVFVVCHHTPEVKVAGFTYITDGVVSALDKAKAAAANKDVLIMGGASIIQQYLALELFDALHIHIAPVLLGKGTSLFDHIGKNKIKLKKLHTVDTPGATHIYYEVLK